MKMKNEKDYEPFMLQWCYIFDFLRSFCESFNKDPNQTVKEFYDKWHLKCGFKQDGIFPLSNNLSVYLASMYVLIVGAKENLLNKIPEIPFNEMADKDWGAFEVLKWNDGSADKHLKNFVRHLRNALSHFRITEDKGKIIFTDCFKERENFKVTCKAEELDKFIFKLTRVIMFKGINHCQ